MTEPIASNDSSHGSSAPMDFLNDVVVLDLGDEATALAGEYLAELGALVLRVESADGDAIRSRGPIWNAVHNAGKRSMAIDLDSDRELRQLEPALRGIDLVLGPLEPTPTVARFLADVPTLTDGRVGVVQVEFRRGDQPGEPVTDLTLGAAGGLVVLNGASDQPPTQPAGDLAFKQTALAVAEAAVALLTARRRNGRAGLITVSAQEAVIITTLQTSNANIHHWHGAVPSRHEQLAAYSTVRSSDGLWTSFTIHPPNWNRFVEWAVRDLEDTGLEHPDWIDPVFVSGQRERIGELIEALAARTSRADLVAEGQARGLLVLPVNDVAEVAADRHLNARGFFEDVRQPRGETVRLPGSPFRSDLGRGRRGPAPELGADQSLAGSLAEREPTAGPTGAPSATDPHQPLAGVRVVDFTWAIAGPLATRLLADLGADVIKIESEHRLDPIRHIGVQPTDVVDLDTNGVFNDAGANKRALTLNLDAVDGREIARELIATADVVIANYTPDRLDKWGLDAETLASLRPGLVVANMAVMGLTGPDAGWRSYGSGLVAMSGIAAHTGFDGTTPSCLGTMHTDFTVPYFGAIAVLAGLHHRDRTGQGMYLELSQYEASVRLMDTEVAEVMNDGGRPGRTANRSRWAEPHGVYPALGHDRWVAIACRDESERQRLAEVLGRRPDEDSLTQWARSRTREDVVDTLRRHRIPVAMVEDLADQLADPQTARLWETLPLPSGVTARVIHEPIVWDGERLPLRRAPMWQEHTFDILVGELGMMPDRFADLVDRRVLW